METLQDIGEKKLLQMLQQYLGKDQSIIRSYSEDCAVIDDGGRNYKLYSVDSLVEGIHFRRDYMPFYFVGRKALKVNLSDIASMGGTPKYYLVSIGAPPGTPVLVLQDVYDGMSSVGKEHDVHMIGGNVTSSNQLFIDVTVLGEVSKQQFLGRNGAKVGDAIFVTGALGEAAVGLSLLREGFRLTENGLILPNGKRDSHLVVEAIQTQMDPPSLVDAGKKLARSSFVSAMIDLSDGISSDLKELCQESGVGARIEMRSIPIAPSVLYWEGKRNRDPYILALQGGEDYHLLFTVSRKFRTPFLKFLKTNKLRVFEIGHIVAKSNGIYSVDESGKTHPLHEGFQHFR